MRYTWPHLLPLLILASCTTGTSRPSAPESGPELNGIPVKKMLVERPPDLNTPRSMHAICEVGGELVVFGGTTTGFTSTRTAEYYAMGQWHQIPMLYNHPSGFATELASGEILLGGGCSEDFGIGQSWGVERYLPAKHRFESLPILDRKRACPTAAELPDGSIVVSGNWYADDGMEIYDGEVSFTRAASSSSSRLPPRSGHSPISSPRPLTMPSFSARRIPVAPLATPWSTASAATPSRSRCSTNTAP